MCTKDKVREIFESLLEHKIKDGDTVSMDTEELWDSLMHITIMMTLEDELGVSIPPSEFSNLTDMQKIISKIEELRNNE